MDHEDTTPIEDQIEDTDHQEDTAFLEDQIESNKEKDTDHNTFVYLCVHMLLCLI